MNINNEKICDYGCGKIALFMMKNGKLCCSKTFRSCDFIRYIRSVSRKGKIHSEKTKEKMRIKRKQQIISEDTKKKISNSKKGKLHTEAHKRKNRESHLGIKLPPFTDEHRRNMGFARIGKKIHSEEWKEKHRQFMLQGGAIIALKGNKNPSKPEVKLRDMVREIDSNCEFQYPVFNYALDIALVAHKIAIEYDGYFHFDTEDHKQYHKLRQERIEKDGWKFLRFNKIPSLEKLSESIKNLIKENY